MFVICSLENRLREKDTKIMVVVVLKNLLGLLTLELLLFAGHVHMYMFLFSYDT